MQQKSIVILMVCLFALSATGKSMASTDKAPLELITSCLAHLHTLKHANGRLVLSDTCPELSLQLDDPQLAQFDPPLDDVTTIGQLKSVEYNLRSLQTQATQVRAPAVTGLSGLLKKIYDPAKHVKPDKNPYEKLMDWINEKIQHFFSQDNWLTRSFHFENKLGKNAIKGIINIIAILMVVVVLYILVNELRAAKFLNLFNRRRGNCKDHGEQILQKQSTSTTGLNEISQMPLAHQVPALVRHTLQFLMDKQVLPRRYNLTNREFLAILKQKLPEASDNFTTLVDSGDRVVYGKQVLAADTTSQLIASVRQIEQLPVKAGR